MMNKQYDGSIIMRNTDNKLYQIKIQKSYDVPNVVLKNKKKIERDYDICCIFYK
jgi:DNA-binding LacI/PurR family transcriptional regulator